MPNQFDVLVVDLDGTLLASNGTVSHRNREAIDEARAAGLTVIIATGRVMVESLEPLKAIAHEGLVIGAGGALLSDAKTGQTLISHTMPEDLVVDVTHALLKHDHKVLILKDSKVAGYDYLAVGDAEMDPASIWWFEVLPVTVRFVMTLAEDPHPHESVRVGVVASEGELAPLADQLKQQVGDRCFMQHWAAVTETAARGSETHLLEIFNPQVNKWTMVKDYCDREGIDPTRVVAIGDGINDEAIVRHAGLGIAMANADPPVLDAADWVTSHDHNEDGVAEAIGYILNGQR